MQTFIDEYNSKTTRPVRRADIKHLADTKTSDVGFIASQINSFMQLRTGVEAVGTYPASYSYSQFDKILQLIALPRISETGGEATLRVIIAIRDKKAMDEPKYHDLIEYNLNIAHPKDVIAGLLLSLTEGPLAEISYIKLKIDILRDFVDALYSTLIPKPISK